MRALPAVAFLVCLLSLNANPQNGPQFTWKHIDQKKISIPANTYAPIPIVIGMGSGRDQATLVRISVDSESPVDIGLVRDPTIDVPPVKDFEGFAAVKCGHAKITKLITTCGLLNSELRRNLIVQDAGESWLDPSHYGKSTPNIVTISVDAYTCLNCPQRQE